MNRKLIALTVLSSILLGGCQAGDLPFVKNDKGEQEKNQSETGGHSDKKADKEPDDLQASSEMTIPSSSYNVTTDINGKKVIQNSDNLLILVNKEYALPGDYAPKDLVKPNVNFSFGDSDDEKSFLRQEAAKALEDMFQAAMGEGIELFAVSGYRSYQRQEVLFNAEIQQVGREKAEQAVALPGTSEHQTGLSMDISSKSEDLLLTQSFESVPEGIWLKENAYKYGYIMRYPKGKEDITGYEYEPWHYRYVGKETAKILHDKNYTLEEYFKTGKKI
ncbi:M15 family metallopeptidase [Peribacillus deserti]|uniref:Peptidase M15 n=1 Tax=Peribacillus deserti TaxID=673318 RepID=A0A2N5M361_9BACI|nr:M15 family metallopeptidase [Peribacillus deserti]PLT28713.1 peptidase M15 [Peribacillus deserti]